MQFIDVETVETVDQAKETIKLLQDRLLDCERHLDDMARSAEIAVITKQFHLMESFINHSNEFLLGRLVVPEQDTSDMKIVVAKQTSKDSDGTKQED